ncbi:MAG: hypothetical protein R3251_02095 [Candidatus Spechtbacterales bacterium]|nr:hypothetical protein [Candidatus Spechtbacterales bacterium]
MIWFWIVGGLTFLTIFFIFGVRGGEYGIGIFGGIILGAIAGVFIGALIGSIVGNNIYEELPPQIEEYELVAIQDGTETRGSLSGFFFIVAGNIRENFYYTYYYKDDNEHIRFGKKRADYSNVVVKEEDRKDAKLTVYSHVKKWRFWGSQASEVPEIKYEFVVPKGTVKRGLNLDLDTK